MIAFAITTAGSIIRRGTLAQLVEQRPEEPCVPSSSLGGATKLELERSVTGPFFICSLLPVLSASVPSSTLCVGLFEPRRGVRLAAKAATVCQKHMPTVQALTFGPQPPNVNTCTQ